ncbi:MAG TPA: ABC transporter permease subunit [Pseudolysinimonas sp.]|nr:ABC transporter permease subunit [Pseudolysinimonas sp.]
MDWGWIGRNLDQMWSQALEHAALSTLPIVIGFLISVPLGYWASRSTAARSILFVLGNIVYTIPAIALIVFVPVTLGLAVLDPRNLVVALTLYAIALMVRAASDAFAAVPHDVTGSATAVGFSGIQRFFAVDLPLAGPVLLAGVRVVSVSTVSLVSVGALTGIDNLGMLFTDAFRNDNFPEAVAGIVAVLIIAAVFDIVLSLIGRLLMPWNRRSPSRVLRPTVAI